MHNVLNIYTLYPIILLVSHPLYSLYKIMDYLGAIFFLKDGILP